MADTPRRIYRKHPPSNAAFSAAEDRGTDSLSAPSVAGAAAGAADSRYDRSEPASTADRFQSGDASSTEPPQKPDALLADEKYAPAERKDNAPAKAKSAKAHKPKRNRKGKTKVEDAPPTPEEVIRQKRRRCADAEDIAGFFTKLIAIVVLLGLLFGFAFGITPAENDDMAPRISAGDLLLYYRLADDMVTGDVLVFEKDGQQYVGRIVARPGDTVEVTDQATLVVNNSTVLESNIFYTTPKYEDGPAYPITLADDEYFLLCDFREGARDSRYFGPVKQSEIKGKVITVIRRSGL